MTESITAERTRTPAVVQRDFHIATEMPGIELHTRNERLSGIRTFDAIAAFLTQECGHARA